MSMTVYTTKRLFKVPLRYYDIRSAGPTLVNNIAKEELINTKQDKTSRNIQYGKFLNKSRIPFPFG